MYYKADSSNFQPFSPFSPHKKSPKSFEFASSSKNPAKDKRIQRPPKDRKPVSLFLGGSFCSCSQSEKAHLMALFVVFTQFNTGACSLKTQLMLTLL